ncbi:MAG: fibrobacter succinogenes major paralogous domain-containing protein [Bacteroidetes bacterium]|nr:fibrobacter succinogenes major paralogous domain-containing protein [Bacteroidota bacterium]
MKTRTNFFIGYFLLISLGMVLLSSCKKSDDSKNSTPPATTVTDKDGNVYHTVTIGTQVWMVENLKTTKYNDGSSIPLATHDWYGSLITPGYCWYDNDIANKNTYGALYNWSVNMSILAPTGWHVPSDAEWTILINYLGGEGVAGYKLMEKGATHWPSPNTGATNESGFTALPGGHNEAVYFDGIGQYGRWWSSTAYDSVTAWDRYIAGIMQREHPGKSAGLSVRCLRN